MGAVICPSDHVSAHQVLRSATKRVVTTLAHHRLGANTYKFYEDVNELVQEEPTEAQDPELSGQLAAIGIMKGKAFAPDERMKKILTDAAAVGNATARQSRTARETRKCISIQGKPGRLHLSGTAISS